MTAAGGVIRGSPNFVLNGASTASDSYIWGAITAGQTTAFDVQAVILSVQTNTSCLDSVAQ